MQIAAFMPKNLLPIESTPESDESEGEVIGMIQTFICY